MKRLCGKAGLPGYFTDYSLCATVAMRLFEKIMLISSSHTGQLITSGVYSYKKTREIQIAVTFDVLNKSAKAQAQGIEVYC